MRECVSHLLTDEQNVSSSTFVLRICDATDMKELQQEMVEEVADLLPNG